METRVAKDVLWEYVYISDFLCVKLLVIASNVPIIHTQIPEMCVQRCVEMELANLSGGLGKVAHWHMTHLSTWSLCGVVIAMTWWPVLESNYSFTVIHTIPCSSMEKDVMFWEQVCLSWVEGSTQETLARHLPSLQTPLLQLPLPPCGIQDGCQAEKSLFLNTLLLFIVVRRRYIRDSHRASTLSSDFPPHLADTTWYSRWMHVVPPHYASCPAPEMSVYTWKISTNCGIH